MFLHNQRYLQLAFNDSIDQVENILPSIPRDNRIIIEAGTPLIKREGMAAVRAIASAWKGHIVADLKTMDGAVRELEHAYAAGATAATVLGAAPVETIDLFIKKCKELEMNAYVDMINRSESWKVLRKLKSPPSVVVLHKGRDEEQTRGKVIDYKQINKIRSKYDIIIAAAGGIHLRESESAIFNGASIVIVNIVSQRDSWRGINTDDNITDIVRQFLAALK